MEWTDGQTDGLTDDAKTISLRLRWGIIYVDDIIGVLQGDYLKILFYSMIL